MGRVPRVWERGLVVGMLAVDTCARYYFVTRLQQVAMGVVSASNVASRLKMCKPPMSRLLSPANPIPHPP